MDIILCQQLQLLQCLIGSKSTVGIDAQLHLITREAAADEAYQVQFFVEADGSYLQFDASESRFHLFFDALQHLVVRAHPHQSVDRDALLASSKGSVEENRLSALQMEHRRFQAEEDGRVGAKPFGIEPPCSCHVIAGFL